MRKFTLLAFVSLFCAFANTGEAQKLETGTTKQIDPVPLKRCWTMEYTQQLSPNGNRQGANPASASRLNDNQRLTAIVTIPVVFHVVSPNPNQISDADLQGQIDRLNLDFSGLNPDSTNIPAAFGPLRGHSQIRFALAKRTPAGAFSNGIERRVSNTAFTGGANDPIKFTAQGGLDAWDANSYFNIWVGRNGGGILGYAQFPGSGPATTDGVVLNIVGTGSNTCYVDPSFNLGRTGSHEVGHYLGLLHLWGDENGCTGDDFRDLTAVGSTFSLPATLANPPGQGNTSNDVGDTPNQGGPTSGCLTGVRTDACSAVAPGFQYQNYMDYTDDACYSMFTNKQVARMEYVLNNFRAGFLTSLGLTPPAGSAALDISPTVVVSPGGSEFNSSTCTTTNYPLPTCPGVFTPRVTVSNNGTTTITGLTVTAQIVNGLGTSSVSRTVTGLNVVTGRSVTIDLQATLTFAVGVNTISFTTSLPNGGVDQVTTNDVLTTIVTIAAPAPVPAIQTFETTPFPGVWSIVNPNGNNTWFRVLPGSNSATSLAIDNATNNVVGNTDDFRSPTLSVNPADSIIITFDLAHKNWPGFSDNLSVLISTNCGSTFTSVYSKTGAALATAGSLAANYVTPIQSDWRTERIGLGGAQLAGGQILVAFRNTNGWGNNIFLDNINIAKKADRDIQLVSIVSPNAAECTGTITPRVTVKNNGGEQINSFKVGYRIGNGADQIKTFTQTLVSGASATVTLDTNPVTVPSGAQVITAWTFDPVSSVGTGDQQIGNDTLRKNFTVRPILASPLAEGFEGSFPPTNWTINNPNAGTGTWLQKAPGRNSGFSAFIDNFTNDNTGQIDEMRMPPINVAGRDSVVFTFDLAHKTYPGFPDVLSILASADCGNTFTTVYSKSGAALATAGQSTAGYNRPAANEWRTERVAIGGPLVASGNVIFYVRNTGGFGNNIFVDNINIKGVSKRDLQMVSINTPAAFVCSAPITPTVTVKNVGIETITGFKVAYGVDFNTPTTTTVTSINLARDASMNVTLNAGTLSTPGQHSIRVYSFEPITASGTGDMSPQDDTLTKIVSLSATVPAPLAENFVNAGFPPFGWVMTNPDIHTTWSRSLAGNGNVGSAFLNSFNYTGVSNRDELITPVLTYSGVDSIHVAFDLASVAKSYPGTTAIPVDTLEVLVTTNCGNTYQSIYKKWGQDLQTSNAGAPDPNFPEGIAFEPTQANQWRRESIDISSFISNPSVQVVFRATTNNGNNIYLDNVNVTTRTLPAQLKQKGYLVLPNPFNNQFNIWHLQTPTTLKYVNVYDSKGALVWSRAFNKNSEKVISVDLSSQPAGVYMVNVGYEDEYRNVSERVIKR